MKFSYPPKFEFDDEPCIWQNPDELNSLHTHLLIHEKSLLEIGTGDGLLAEYFREEGLNVWSIDDNPICDGHDNLLVEDSHSKEALEWALLHGPYDIVFIDGGHRYRDVASDFLDYARMGKYCVLHDIDGNQAGKYPVELGPMRFWNQIKHTHHTVEISAKKPENCGIGIIRMK